MPYSVQRSTVARKYRSAMVHHNHRRAAAQTWVCAFVRMYQYARATQAQHSASGQIALSYTLHARVTARCSAGSRNFNTFKLNSFRFRNNCFSSGLVGWLVGLCNFVRVYDRPFPPVRIHRRWKFAEVTLALVKTLFAGGG